MAEKEFITLENTCIVCGRPIKIVADIMKIKPDLKTVFCSKECATIKNNLPNSDRAKFYFD